VGQSRSAIDAVCGEAASATLDGYPAYDFCGNFDVYSDNGVDTQSTGGAGWVETQIGYGYQCTEWAVRYFHFKWSVSHPEDFMGDAKDYCASHPAEVTVTTSPIHGDLAVITPGCGGADPTTGHVTAIDTLSTSNIFVVQQNPAGKFSWPRSCVACYLHAAKNVVIEDPCTTAPSNGYYCGQSTQWGGATPNVLYDCQGGVTASSTPCAYGCDSEPAGIADQCNPAPPDAGTTGHDAAIPSTDAGSPAEETSPQPEAGASSSSFGASPAGCAMARSREGRCAWIGLAFGVLAAARRRPRSPPEK
jgi:hypothetical protein